jgi:hypothetical protein
MQRRRSWGCSTTPTSCCRWVPLTRVCKSAQRFHFGFLTVFTLFAGSFLPKTGLNISRTVSPLCAPMWASRTVCAGRSAWYFHFQPLLPAQISFLFHELFTLALLPQALADRNRVKQTQHGLGDMLTRSAEQSVHVLRAAFLGCLLFMCCFRCSFLSRSLTLVRANKLRAEVHLPSMEADDTWLQYFESAFKKAATVCSRPYPCPRSRPFLCVCAHKQASATHTTGRDPRSRQKWTKSTNS